MATLWISMATLWITFEAAAPKIRSSLVARCSGYLTREPPAGPLGYISANSYGGGKDIITEGI